MKWDLVHFCTAHHKFLVGQHFQECELLAVNGKKPTHYNRLWTSEEQLDLNEADMEEMNDFYRSLGHQLAILEDQKKIVPTLAKTKFTWDGDHAQPPSEAWEEKPQYRAWIAPKPGEDDPMAGDEISKAEDDEKDLEHFEV